MRNRRKDHGRGCGGVCQKCKGSGKVRETIIVPRGLGGLFGGFTTRIETRICNHCDGRGTR